MTATDISPALKIIGYDLTDIPSYCIEQGRIVIAIADNDGDEAEKTLNKLRRHLPIGAAAEWTGNSDTNGDGDTTSDCAITWGDFSDNAATKKNYEAITGHTISESVNGADMLTKEEVWVSGLETWRTWEQLGKVVEMHSPSSKSL